MKETFGERIKRLRLKNQLTQEQVAEKMRVNRKAISHYENNLRGPSLEVLIQMSELYRESTDYLLGVEKKRAIDAPGLNDKQYDLIKELVDELSRKNTEQK